MGSRSSGGTTGCHAANSALCRGVALRARGRRHKDHEVAPNDRASGPMRQGARHSARSTDAERRAAGEQWHETGLVFTTRLGTAMDAANVRRDFRRALALVPGLKPEEWTPRELRHSFVSLLSDAGLPIEDVSRLVGHSSTSVTELVYRHQIRPVVQSGATIMDRLFGSPGDRPLSRLSPSTMGSRAERGPR